jgi:Lrp/AsnC family transcriptional regulator for asnA, asnC and gidA
LPKSWHMFNSLMSKYTAPGGMMLDDTDRRIISVLQSDARASMRSIAEQAGVSLGTVSNRVHRLEDAGVIRGYTVQLNPELSGWELTVVIGLRIQKGRLIEIQEKIAQDNRIYSAYDVTGEFDSMIIARAKDRRDLDDLTKNVISIDGVESSVTHLVLNTVKESSTVIPE